MEKNFAKVSNTIFKIFCLLDPINHKFIFSLKQKEGAGKTVLNLQQLQIENAQGQVKLEGIWQNLLQCKCQTAECKVLLQQEWLKIP